MAYYRTPHDVTALPAWQALKDHRQAMQDFSMREAFNADPQRFTQFTLSSCGLFLDYSKNLINAETRDLLVGLANEVDLQGAIKALFDGEIVNSSEGRPALHTALRRPVGDKLSVNGVNVMPEVHKVLNQITDLVGRIHDGLWRGYTEKPITDVVNIGIGGAAVLRAERRALPLSGEHRWHRVSRTDHEAARRDHAVHRLVEILQHP
jgi:glucose-6-phosphate isomerase